VEYVPEPIKQAV